MNCGDELEQGMEEVILACSYKGQVSDQYNHFWGLYPKVPHKHLLNSVSMLLNVQ